MPTRLADLIDRGLLYLGPALIALATTMISGCVVLYFAFLLPSNYPSPESDGDQWSLWTWTTYSFNVLLTLYLTVMISFNYFYACTLGPGRPEDEGQQEAGDGRRILTADDSQQVFSILSRLLNGL